MRPRAVAALQHYWQTLCALLAAEDDSVILNAVGEASELAAWMDRTWEYEAVEG